MSERLAVAADVERTQGLALGVKRPPFQRAPSLLKGVLGAPPSLSLHALLSSPPLPPLCPFPSLPSLACSLGRGKEGRKEGGRGGEGRGGVLRRILLVLFSGPEGKDFCFLVFLEVGVFCLHLFLFHSD